MATEHPSQWAVDDKDVDELRKAYKALKNDFDELTLTYIALRNVCGRLPRY